MIVPYEQLYPNAPGKPNRHARRQQEQSMRKQFRKVKKQYEASQRRLQAKSKNPELTLAQQEELDNILSLAALEGEKHAG